MEKDVNSMNKENNLVMEDSQSYAIKTEKIEYFLLVLLNYLYYNITLCRSRKILIEDIATFFDELYESFIFETVLSWYAEDFLNYSINTTNKKTINDICNEIKELIKEVSKNEEYQKMFHLEDDGIIIDDGFSFSPDEEKYWHIFYYNKLEHLKKCLCSTINDFLYGPFRGNWSETEKCIVRFLSRYRTDVGKSVLQIKCEEAINKSHTPKISPESEKIRISKKNYELGKLLAARFIYRCGKDWYRCNAEYLCKLMRNKEIIIDGLDYADELKKVIDEYRNNINSKYIELANRFAFLLQTAKNNSIVYNSEYVLNKNCIEDHTKVDSDEAFQVARNNYINSQLDTPFYQSFLVKKDENGDIWLLDSGLDASVNINEMSEDKKKEFFKTKDLLDRVVEKEKKKKECEEFLHQYMLEQPSYKKTRISFDEPLNYTMGDMKKIKIKNYN